MEQFIGVAVAHFLALLVPGVDFLLIVRTSLSRGWRSATGVCVGIAAANAVIIAVCFTGVSLITHPVVLTVIRTAGGLFLMYVGIAFWRSASALVITGKQSGGASPTTAAADDWIRNAVLGLASGLLNPKNILFYASLATVLSSADASQYVVYGVWMVAVLLGWDTLIAVLLGSSHALTRASRALPLITRASGAFLMFFGVAMLAEVISSHLR